MERIVAESVDIARDMMALMIRRNFPHDEKTLDSLDNERDEDCLDVALREKRHSPKLIID